MPGNRGRTAPPRSGRNTPPARLTHLDGSGRARMVDVGGKPVTHRTATAEAEVRMSAAAWESLAGGALPKGDAAAVARLAGIMAAKRTSELIPLCHALPIDAVRVEVDASERGRVRVTAEVSTAGRTGVEMEALTAVSVAALAVYDMCKALDRAIEIGPIRLLAKSGGRSGPYRRGRSDKRL